MSTDQSNSGQGAASPTANAGLTLSCKLGVSVDVFLAPFDMEAVNFELWPIAKMTAPGPWRRLPILKWPTGNRLFGSWVLLGGLIPCDRHQFRLARVDPQQGFCEESTSWLHRNWSHQRCVAAIEGGCRVTDTLWFDSRLMGAGRFVHQLYRLVFAHRHKRLRRRYGPPIDEGC